MVIKVRRTISYILVALSIVLFTVLSTSCVSTKKPIDVNNNYNPPVTILNQPESSDLNVCVNKSNSASFSIPVIIDTDLSMFNTSALNRNDKLYVTNITGEGIDDLLIEGLQYNCYTSNTGIGDDPHGNFVCVFNFKIETKGSWISNGIVRKITRITFKILDSTISVPVNVSIFEKTNKAKFVNECPILKNSQYLTLAERKVPQADNKLSYNLALNWDIGGWGGHDWEDDNYATIVGLYFANSALQMDSFAIIVDNDVGVAVPETSILIDLSDVNYDLKSRQCYWGGNFVEFEVLFVGSNYQVVSDFLIMQYTLNGGTEIFEVNLATIQLYDYDTLLAREE